MNAIEIEQAISELAEQKFDAAEFPFAFLMAFGNKETTIRRLRKGETNKSDLASPWGGVLQANNIHIAVAPKGEVTQALAALKASPATAKHKAKYILATDGEMLEAEELASGEAVACHYADFPNHFGFFLALAGITTVQQIKENAFDIRATSRLNRLYVELLKDNPDWGAADRRHDMNHFMARLIFCFFAEDTDIFNGTGLFTATVEQMSARDASDTHMVISAIFQAMNTKPRDRATAGLRPWADQFPYVNGGLFSGSVDVPRFSRIARSYLLAIGRLDWTKINPDIFGSMIQAVADDEERGALGMHYTSVPNILKVLNPLFLDDLRAKLAEADDNPRMLLNLRKRMARIRVFDPACGSGNFLVIAYKQMREIEAEINQRRGEPGRKSDIPLTNFRGIEIRDFPAEIARLALIIAEYQCDVLYRGQKEALAEFLPLDAQNWIVCGNALRLDWLSICPPMGTGVKHQADDLFHTPLDQAQIDFENDGGETYICGNPPYTGYNRQSAEQKSDIDFVFSSSGTNFGNLDYVCCWLLKAALYNEKFGSKSAFVTTNSICQGGQVPVLWPILYKQNQKIFFARTSFNWSNLASRNAGITVIVVGLQSGPVGGSVLFIEDKNQSIRQDVNCIGPYLVPNSECIVDSHRQPLSDLPIMTLGNHPYYASELIMERNEAFNLISDNPEVSEFVRPYFGSSEIIRGAPRHCLWVSENDADRIGEIPEIKRKFEIISSIRRSKKGDVTALALAYKPYRFRDCTAALDRMVVVPQVSSERRQYLPVDILDSRCIVSFQAYALYDAPTHALSIVCSRMHWIWIATVCRRMRTDFSYSNTLGWNTFPVPTLTEKNKADLTRCAEDILLAREAHFPATIADLYDPDAMPDDLRQAHERNDEVLERIYIGRRFRNDTERLEKLFDLYTKMVAAQPAKKAGKSGKGRS